MRLCFSAACLALLLVASVARAEGTDGGVPDPFEPVNRGIFTVNVFLDDWVLVPVAKGYRTVTPDVVQVHLRHALDNLREPRNFVNAVLQGDPQKAGFAFTRFAVNSTFGVLGLFDVAGSEGVTPVDEDFGQTLGVWGVGSGPYLMLPVMGPSTLRDTVGRVGDGLAFDPLAVAVGQEAHLDAPWYGQTALRGIDLRARNIENVAAIRQGSVDYYAKVRSLYWQRMMRETAEENQEKKPVNQDQQDQIDQDFDNFFSEEAQPQ